FRMEKHVFINFCEALQARGWLKKSRYVSIPEKVAIFLLILSHNERVRLVAERFQHWGWTISNNFHKVLKAACRLGKPIIKLPNFDTKCLRLNPKYFPFCKDCVGAIEGTHIDAHIPANQQIPYRRKNTTQNIMCVSFDMCFTFVMTGWEGTANDSRIFLECVCKLENKFPLPTGEKYYVVDYGYSNMQGFLSPF
ncbi:LOW QUALITY PROTEIN: DDE_4 domain-containing protein, partial [Cephalotus follicularis]